MKVPVFNAKNQCQISRGVFYISYTYTIHSIVPKEHRQSVSLRAFDMLGLIREDETEAAVAVAMFNGQQIFPGSARPLQCKQHSQICSARGKNLEFESG